MACPPWGPGGGASPPPPPPPCLKGTIPHHPTNPHPHTSMFSPADALRLRSFEGFYNLSFLLLLFSLIYLLVRNVQANGLQASLHDFTCVSPSRCLKLVPFCVRWPRLGRDCVGHWVSACN